MITGSEREDEFEAYLKRRVPIDRRLKSLNRLEPPAELDRLIISQAREAIQGAPAAPLFRGPRWALPMGLAATIFISLSILLDLGMQGAVRRDAGKAPAVWVGVLPESSQRVAGPRVSEAVEPSGGLPAPEMAPAPAVASGPSWLAASVASATSTASAASTAAAASAASSASARSSDRVQPTPFKVAPWPPVPDSAARAAAAAPKAAPGVDEAANPAAASAADDSRSRTVEHALAASRLRRSAEASGTGSAEPVPAAPPPEAHMEIVTVVGTRVHEAYAMNSPIAVTSISSAGAVDLTPPYVPDTSNIQSEGGPSWAAERHRHPNPKVWLDHIQKMRAAGLAAEADQELRRLHDAYPDFPATP